MDFTIYKITNRFYIGIVLVFVFTFFYGNVSAQDSIFIKNRATIISDKIIYINSVKNDPGKMMVDIKKYIPGITIDCKYATTNNFLTIRLYPELTTTYIRNNAVKALLLVQEELNRKGLGLKILDAYRPFSVTEKIWKQVHDDRYAADPKKGSGHNRGIAVDLTIINLKTKKELNMGTGFDNFSDTAHHNFTSLPEQVLKNRMLLKSLMEKYGFKALDTEWWHYALADGKNYELLDLSFSDLKMLNDKN